jgi:hypothetical protein
MCYYRIGCGGWCVFPPLNFSGSARDAVDGPKKIPRNLHARTGHVMELESDGVGSVIRPMFC